ncbi:MAG: hypothetical protein ACYC2K_14995 [Gemmatimonadales bacterium]
MQRDIVLRWISQIAALVARLLRGDKSLTMVVVRDELTQAVSTLLGPLDRLAPHLDATQLADLLIDPHRIHGYAELLALESALERAEGRTDAALRLAERARVLLGEAIHRSREPVPEWEAWADALDQDLASLPGAAAT